MLASAQSGVLPPVPNFKAETHKRFHPKLAEVVALVEAGDAEALRAYTYAGFVSSSPRAILKYRDGAGRPSGSGGKRGGLTSGRTNGAKAILHGPPFFGSVFGSGTLRRSENV
jgi:hypothetical protein